MYESKVFTCQKEELRHIRQQSSTSPTDMHLGRRRCMEPEPRRELIWQRGFFERPRKRFWHGMSVSFGVCDYKMPTSLRSSNPGVLFRTSMSLSLKNTGFFSMTLDELNSFWVIHQYSKPGICFKNQSANLTRPFLKSSLIRLFGRDGQR